MTVEDLKNKLSNMIEALDEYDDMDEVELSSNYGGMDGDFVYVGGFVERGFFNPDNIIIKGDKK